MNPTAVPTTGPPTRPDTVMTKVLVLAMAAWVEIVGKKFAGRIVFLVISIPVRLAMITNIPKIIVKIILACNF